MERVAATERPEWERIAHDMGFAFAHADGARYWDERAWYRFTLNEIENGIEEPTADLHAMCLDLVEEVVRSDQLMERLAIPTAMRDLVAGSWAARAPSLYGRFDFSFDGSGPAKLLEYNADTPTSIFETALFQWRWLEDMMAAGQLPPDADQYNRLHEALVERFAALFTPGSLLHFSSVADHLEDRQTVRYLEDAARQADLDPEFVAIDAIGIDTDDRFVDENGVLIAAVFKLYPWEDLLREPYAAKLPLSHTQFIEPAWKSLLSNKGILPLLWERHRGHPNLLPAAFEGTPEASAIGGRYVRKPLFSREGWDIHLIDGAHADAGPQGGYGEEGWVVQELAPLPVFDGGHAVIGSWIVGDEPVALSVREDVGPITRDLARFCPHAIA